MIDNIEIFNNLKLKDQSMEGYNPAKNKTCQYNTYQSVARREP